MHRLQAVSNINDSWLRRSFSAGEYWIGSKAGRGQLPAGRGWFVPVYAQDQQGEWHTVACGLDKGDGHYKYTHVPGFEKVAGRLNSTNTRATEPPLLTVAFTCLQPSLPTSVSV